MTNRQETWKIEHSIETSAAPEAVWAILREVARWKEWNAGVEGVELEGAFATGAWFTMIQPGGERLRSRLADVRENEHFIDETQVGDLLITVAHRLARLGKGGTRVTYAVEATGPGAADVGPMVASDFPDVLKALAARAVGGRA